MTRYINNEIIKGLFPNKIEEYAGYWNIVSRLIDKGKCITTTQAYDIDYGQMSEYTHIEPYTEGVDLIEIFLDKEAIIVSNIFKEEKLKLIDKYKDDVKNTETKLKYIKDMLEELLNSVD